MESDNAEWYEQVPSSHAALVYGEVTEGEHPRHVLTRFGQEAYEMLQLHVYMRELLRVRNEPGYVCWSPAFGLLWAAVETLRENVVPKTGGAIHFEEIGSTLFSSIDKLEKLRDRHKGACDIATLRFTGVEPVRIFAQTAEALHPAFHVTHAPRWQDLHELPGLTIARSYQATSYAFSNVGDLCAWVFRSIFSLHGVWFSLKGMDEVVPMHGKRATLFCLEEFHARAAAAGFELIPISAEKFRLGNIEFLAVFLALHHFDERTRHRFFRICDACEGFGAGDLAAAAAKDFLASVHERTEVRGDHAGMMEPEMAANATDPTFNFGMPAVLQSFREYVTAMSRQE